MNKLIDAIARDLGTAPNADRIVAGRIVRFGTNGKRCDSAGWLMLFEDQRAAVYGDWRTGVSHTWRAAGGKRDRKAEREVIAAAQAARAQEEAQRHADASEHAALIWTRAQPCDRHPYLERKQVQQHGLRVQFAHAVECREQFYAPDADGETKPLHGLLLLVPMRDVERRLWSLQAIDADGRKSFLRGGRVRGMFHVVGRDLLQGAGRDWSGTIAIAEGYATGATVYTKQRWPVAIAFNAGNLEAVTLAIRKRLPKARIVVTGDADAVGLQRAREAAAAVGGLVSIPPFTPEELQAGLSDWNDLFLARGTQPKREVA